MKCYDSLKNGMVSIMLFSKSFGKKECIEYLDKIFSFDDFNSEVSNYTISLKKSEDKCFEQIRNICGFVSHDEQDKLDLMFSPVLRSQTLWRFTGTLRTVMQRISLPTFL